ncbi:hypothetical protein J8J14_10185 [Roseomonas sp. SSH11]|uniref:Uncharacterized protein n=1 Tax=Pararoseomonas baculiformis TaxID=2820812 RepID=A0ABS4AF43_9PROT|nr:hypothetical protein [Pararoseomonas baculiformis]MBP0445148.1 hypothetical protein [Pararoseomonas baculiformis]
MRSTEDAVRQEALSAPVARKRLRRLPWPAAALVILGLSVLFWVAIIGLLR